MPHAVEDESTDLRDVYTRRSSFDSSSSFCCRKVSKDLLRENSEESVKVSKLSHAMIKKGERGGGGVEIISEFESNSFGRRFSKMQIFFLEI